MIGAALMIIWLVIVFPVAFLMGMAVVASLLGGSLRGSVAADNEGSELLALNR